MKREREREREKLGPPKGFPTLKFRAYFPASLWSLYIGLELSFSIVEITQISFKIKINIIYLYRCYEYLKIFGEINYLTNIVD